MVWFNVFPALILIIQHLWHHTTAVRDKGERAQNEWGIQWREQRKHETMHVSTNSNFVNSYLASMNSHGFSLNDLDIIPSDFGMLVSNGNKPKHSRKQSGGAATPIIQASVPKRTKSSPQKMTTGVTLKRVNGLRTCSNTSSIRASEALMEGRGSYAPRVRLRRTRVWIRKTHFVAKQYQPLKGVLNYRVTQRIK